MAFFEFLASIGETLSSALGKFIKPVGGQGSGNFTPNPAQSVPSPPALEADVIVQDGAGSLQVRGQSLTDEGSFADDFLGSSLTTALTGTPVFTNGSTTVTGSGTLFTSELDTDFHIKRDSDGDSAWTRVARVISDTSLELDSDYSGTTGGSASSKSFWSRSIGTGGSITVGSGSVALATGTTNGSVTRIFRAVDYLPFHIHSHVIVSQRIANQSIFFGVADDPDSPTAFCGIIIDGTDNTTVKFHSQTSNAAADQNEVTVTLPFGLTTASEISYEIHIGNRAATLVVEGLIVAELTEHIPDPYLELFLVAEVENTGVPSSSTTLTIGFINILNFNVVQVTNLSVTDPVAVQIREEVHNVTGVLTSSSTTADQVIVSYTVPANRVAYIAGFTVSVDGNTDGLPIKVGRNTVTTEPVSPGSTDGNIFRMFRLDRPSTGGGAMYSEEYSAMPRPIGRGGDVIKMTVTPSGTGSTKWRASLDIVLRT